MNNILIVYSSRIPTVELLCDVMRCFSEEDFTVREMAHIDVRKKDIEWANIVLSIRPFNKSAYAITSAAKESGRQVIVYLDDDLLNLPHIYSSRIREFFTLISFEKNCEYLKKVLEHCDVLWGSSPYFIHRYKQYVTGARCVCTNICKELNDVREPSVNPDSCSILYTGSANHYRQLNDLVIPAINKLIGKYPNIVLTCVGMRKQNIADCKAEVICIPWMDYADYYSMVSNMSFDIGVAPTLQEDFYRCKYFNKFIEYSLLGITGIYTDDYPYRYVVQDSVNGFLTANTVDSWTDKIDFVLSNRELAKETVVNAQKYCAEKFSKKRQLDEIKAEIPELFLKGNNKYLPVKYRPYRIHNAARKCANKAVALYEGLRP
ncbi:hypothetical protein SAMN02910275_02940 [Butyrivibrio sp. INlla18]|uniref:glycosyltransferase family 4 protein n=1 Tax=Butyrivibrio sp. INlla18 TaxID=1520806 RepID=UPI00088D56E2|nr:glycosyltransferase family 4 protein [Butyrivibrio sp. INlla18]SDA79153.1 hypothetical protein SAMN02910275_02940 [Butyrivibrio sp. INlla18]